MRREMYKGLSLILTLGCLGLNCLFSSSINAQEVTADGTANTTVNEDGQGNFNIEQGDRSGNNLFHSFGITINATDSVRLVGLKRPLVGLGTEINNH